MKKTKQDTMYINMLIQETVEKGSWQLEDCIYNPRPHDRVILYEKNNKYLLHMKFNTGSYKLYKTLRYIDVEHGNYKKAKIMSYKRAVCFLKRKGYVCTGSRCKQIRSYYQQKYCAPIIGILSEDWE